MTPPTSDEDEAWMGLALQQAQAAADAGEVPVGAVLVHQGRLIATGRNAPIAQHDPTAHAELMALRAAAQHLGNYRLDQSELFVTLEPCTMCAGAILHARLRRVVFATPDSKTGAAGSVTNVFALSALNHHTAVRGGVLAGPAQALLTRFFQDRRLQRKRERAEAGLSLRDDALRTPDPCFAALPDWIGWPNGAASRFLVLRTGDLTGLRLHYLDSAHGEPAPATLCLHGLQSWTYAWQRQLRQAAASGVRLICPDLIGFGLSDKPKKPGFHTVQRQVQALQELLSTLQLSRVRLLTHPDSLTLALALQQAAGSAVGVPESTAPEPLSNEVAAAPYPHAAYRAGPQWAAAWIQKAMA